MNLILYVLINVMLITKSALVKMYNHTQMITRRLTAEDLFQDVVITHLSDCLLLISYQ